MQKPLIISTKEVVILYIILINDIMNGIYSVSVLVLNWIPQSYLFDNKEFVPLA